MGKNMTTYRNYQPHKHTPAGPGLEKASQVPETENLKGRLFLGSGECKVGTLLIRCPWQLPYLTLVLALIALNLKEMSPQLHFAWFDLKCPWPLQSHSVWGDLE